MLETYDDGLMILLKLLIQILRWDFLLDPHIHYYI